MTLPSSLSLPRLLQTCLVLGFLALAGLIASPELYANKPVTAKNAGEKLPFQPGEELTFNLRWGVFNVGTAVLKVNPMAEINGEKVHHFTLNIRTNAFADRFYRVRDEAHGYLSKDLQRSVLYTSKQEGSHERDIRVVFDWKERKATYTNFDQSNDPIDLTQRAFDPLSVFFIFRTLPLEEGANIELPVTDGRRLVEGEGHIRRRETITVPAGEFQTYLAEPDMKDVRGVFDQSDDATLRIWLSDDHRRIPVRLSSKVVVGNFHAELVEIKGEDPLPQPRQRARIRHHRR